MVYSSMVHVAGGEGGSIRHDDDGRPAPSAGSPVSEGRWVHDEQVATMIGMSRLRERNGVKTVGRPREAEHERG